MGVAVSLDTDTQRKPSLDPLIALVADDMKAVNRVIVERMDSPVALIPQLASHVVAAGGKRLRPMLTLAAARLCGYPGQRHIGLAACVECIHTATLLHDDVVDDSELRRGLASANVVWGNKPSVLVGDFLFSRAFELMVEDGSLRVLAILSRASSIIAEGEVSQLSPPTTPRPAKPTTSPSFGPRPPSCSPPPAGSARSWPSGRRRRRPRWKPIGMNLGIAFQLIDDVLDYSAKQATLGKTVGDDFREGKITLPIVLAFSRANAEEKDVLAAHARGDGAGARGSGAGDHAADRPRRPGRRRWNRARQYGAKAIDALEPFAPSPAKRGARRRRRLLHRAGVLDQRRLVGSEASGALGGASLSCAGGADGAISRAQVFVGV